MTLLELSKIVDLGKIATVSQVIAGGLVIYLWVSDRPKKIARKTSPAKKSTKKS